jgi:hypothetical protein
VCRNSYNAKGRGQRSQALLPFAFIGPSGPKPVILSEAKDSPLLLAQGSYRRVETVLERGHDRAKTRIFAMRSSPASFELKGKNK